jgi:hypothetical protein
MKTGLKMRSRRGLGPVCIEGVEPRRLFAAMTFFVTNADNSGAGSLRQAIIDSNLNVPGPGEANTIDITISVADKTVELTAPLPTIINSVYLGRDINEPAPTEPLIELDGTNAGTGANGLVLTASFSSITGIAINRFNGNGLNIVGDFNSISSGVHIGTNIAGTAALANSVDGIYIDGNNNSLSLLKVVHNGDDGIEIYSGTGNNIALGNSVSQIHSNGDRAIELEGDGTWQDPLDADEGANDIQNRPLIDSAEITDGVVTVTGRMITTPDTFVLLDFFANPVDRAEGWQSLTQNVDGQSETPSVTTDSAGLASFTFTLVASPVDGMFVGTVDPLSYISATATALNIVNPNDPPDEQIGEFNTSEFAFPRVIDRGLPEWLDSASFAEWDTETDTLTVTGTATVIADPASYPDDDHPTIVVTAAGSLIIEPHFDYLIHVGSLTIASGGTAIITEMIDDTVFVVEGALSVDGKLDITNNSMVLKTSSLSAITTLIVAGYNNGDFLGSGLTSSSAATDPNFLTAVGYASNVDAAFTNFEGETGLSDSDILIKYTYYGDADLNGSVDLDDFNLFLAGYQDPANVPQTWIYGDFDYTGSVDLDDFNLFLAAYQAAGPQQ